MLKTNNGPASNGFAKNGSTKNDSINGSTSNSSGKHLCLHAINTYQQWEKLQKLKESKTLEINGHDLDIASVVAVAKYGCVPEIERSPAVLEGINGSVEFLRGYLKSGYNVYGVNTGFGGSADSRTTDLPALQRSLMQHTQSAVLTPTDRQNATIETSVADFDPHSMPTAWTKAMTIIRTNATIRGHSAVTIEVAEALIALLKNNITPVIPLRGSISASGDLMPLSFVSGAIQGNPDIYVHTPAGVVTAKAALDAAGLNPIVLGPKEGLGLINGTAASAAVGSLAVYEAHQLAVLSQFLGACAVEAITGSQESFHPFIAAVRPHPGQREVAHTIYSALEGSTLARAAIKADSDKTKSGLFQMRYSMRSTQQWIGPVLEDLMLADKQVSTELNSTTDNPLIDVASQEIWSCANFQAVSITSAMEKTRFALQMLGKIMFAQCTELINPDQNNGLPASLCADDPSLSFTMKGVDVNIAAYQTELAFLASPVSSHVQSAEMHNQAVNSVALISARYTMEAVRLLKLICASHLYVCCQALDLRVMHLGFLAILQPEVRSITAEMFGSVLAQQQLETLHEELWKHIPEAWFATNALDAHERYEKVVTSATGVLAKGLGQADGSIAALSYWREQMLAIMAKTYTQRRAEFFKRQDTAQYLGKAAQRLYLFVRMELGVPLHQGLVEHPIANDPSGNVLDGRPKKIIGSWVGKIYEALRDGSLQSQAMQLVREEQEA
jgi:phenylalanine ammonia-lyase